MTWTLCIILLLATVGGWSGMGAGVHGVVSMEQVAQHAQPTDCWSVVYGNVYDLTAYAPSHRQPGSTVYLMCGEDATELYDLYHGDHKVRESYNRWLLLVNCELRT